MTDEESNQHEQGYVAGERAALRSLLSEILRRLNVPAGDPQKTIARLAKELEDTRAALRSVCSDFGDTEWGDDLYLADVVEKHLARHLHAEAVQTVHADENAPVADADRCPARIDGQHAWIPFNRVQGPFGAIERWKRCRSCEARRKCQ